MIIYTLKEELVIKSLLRFFRQINRNQAVVQAKEASTYLSLLSDHEIEMLLFGGLLDG